MPKITEQRREERRLAIVNAALRCFARSGYGGTSMADIIGESGMSAGAIYGHFTSKQELVRAVATHVLEGRRIELRAAAGEEGLSPAAVAATLIEGVQSHAPLHVILQVWAEAGIDPELRAMVQEVFGRLRATVRESLERWARAHPDAGVGDPAAWAAAAAPVVMGTVPGFVLQRSVVDGFDAESYLRALPTLLPGG